MRRLASHLIALCAVAASALLALPAAASAQAPSIAVHALFSGGKTTNFTAGTPLGVQYNDPSGQTREQQVCWSPAPIALPACTATGTGAPAAAGTQKITVQLTNGKSVSTSFTVGAAATQLGSGTSNAPPESGAPNGDDYFLIDTAFLQQGGPLGASAAGGLAVASAVPEPGAMGLLAVGVSAVLRRRRRR